ncbi:MAG TPA: HypC/HybG/HupF family hydrogenase formation chaperone [Gammaproteobacteria bacterium]|nr:HypC/HybG/HupF family hydrogenase formation chaperone [Gammaproteobacteria bacterium]
MCLAIPAKIESLDALASTAIVNLNNIRKEVSTLLLDEVTVGDYVLVHVGYALERIDPVEAARTLAMFDDMQALGDTE